jgi:signal transduction histidine kinase
MAAPASPVLRPEAPDPRPGGGDRSAPDLSDVIVAAACFVLFTLPLLLGVLPREGSLVAIAALGAGAAVPLAFWRVAPVPVLGAVTVVLVVAAVVGVRFTPFVSNTGPALGVAVLGVADRLPARRSLALGGGALVLVAIAQLVAFLAHPEIDQDFIQPLVAVPGWLIGHAVRTRRGLDRQLQAEAAARAEEAERRVRAEERLRVSADVHDIVSHTLSMIAVRSGVARVVLDQRPGEARIALAAIERASRGALDELRAVLYSLRDADDRPTTAALSARPTLTDIATLVQDAAANGCDVTFDPAPIAGVPPLIGESAYRVVQEALTNVVKHAGRVAIAVEVSRGPDELSVSVLNAPGDPARRPAGGAGLGLTGMRERVALHDGTLTAGPRPDGGFAVRARFPLRDVGAARA